MDRNVPSHSCIIVSIEVVAILMMSCWERCLKRFCSSDVLLGDGWLVDAACMYVGRYLKTRAGREWNIMSVMLHGLLCGAIAILSKIRCEYITHV